MRKYHYLDVWRPLIFIILLVSVASSYAQVPKTFNDVGGLDPYDSMFGTYIVQVGTPPAETSCDVPFMTTSNGGLIASGQIWCLGAPAGIIVGHVLDPFEADPMTEWQVSGDLAPERRPKPPVSAGGTNEVKYYIGSDLIEDATSYRNTCTRAIASGRLNSPSGYIIKRWSVVDVNFVGDGETNGTFHFTCEVLSERPEDNAKHLQHNFGHATCGPYAPCQADPDDPTGGETEPHLEVRMFDLQCANGEAVPLSQMPSFTCDARGIIDTRAVGKTEEHGIMPGIPSQPLTLYKTTGYEDD